MLFALRSSAKLAIRIAKNIKTEVCYVDFGFFKLGEVFIDKNFCADGAVVLFPNTGDVNRDFVLFLLMTKNMLDVKVIIPYVPYSRQDKDKTLEIVAKILIVADVVSVVTLDIHSQKLFGLLHGRLCNIGSFEIFWDCVDWTKEVLFVAPDKGAIERTSLFSRKAAMNDIVFIDKSKKTVSDCEKVKGRSCVVIDDIVDSGKTLQMACEILSACGAFEVDALIMHFFPTKEVVQTLPSILKRIYVANNVFEVEEKRIVDVDWTTKIEKYFL